MAFICSRRIQSAKGAPRVLLFPLVCGERGIRSAYVCVEVSMWVSQKERGTSGSNLTTRAYGSDQLAVGWHDVSHTGAFLKK